MDPAKGQSLTDRILARLIQSEAHEPNLHLRDDYRQSFITLTLASRGNTMPFVVASYQMYGLHPDKVWPAIEARRAAMGYDELPHKTESSCPTGVTAVFFVTYHWAKLAHHHQKKFHYARVGTPRKIRHAFAVGADSLDSAFASWTTQRTNELCHVWDGLELQQIFPEVCV